MTPKQDALYWREWSKVRKAQPDADRHALHVRALGDDKSHKDFSNKEFDQVLAEFRAITAPADVAAQLRQLAQSKTRLIWSIRQKAPEAYWTTIAIDRFGTDDLADLSESQLTQLRNTLAARQNSLRKRVAQPAGRELATAVAAESNEPF